MEEFTITINDLVLGIIALLWIIYSIWAMREFRTNLINKEEFHPLVALNISVNVGLGIGGIISFIIIKYGDTVIL